MKTFKLGLKPSPPITNVAKSRALLARKAPATCLKTGINPKPQMSMNDTLNNCTAAGISNSLRAAAATGGYMIEVPDKDVVKFYSGSTGYNPVTGEHDEGSTGPNALNYGVRHQLDVKNGNFSLLWGDVHYLDRNAVAGVINDLCSCAVGVMLSESDMNQINETGGDCVLTKNNGLYGNTAAGSAGGHFALFWNYKGLRDEDEVGMLTWGSRATRCTWEWFEDRGMEAHAVIWKQLARPDGKYVNGEVIDDLVREYGIVTA